MFMLMIESVLANGYSLIQGQSNITQAGFGIVLALILVIFLNEGIKAFKWIIVVFSIIACLSSFFFLSTVGPSLSAMQAASPGMQVEVARVSTFIPGKHIPIFAIMIMDIVFSIVIIKKLLFSQEVDSYLYFKRY